MYVARILSTLGRKYDDVFLQSSTRAVGVGRRAGSFHLDSSRGGTLSEKRDGS